VHGLAHGREGVVSRSIATVSPRTVVKSERVLVRRRPVPRAVDLGDQLDPWCLAEHVGEARLPDSEALSRGHRRLQRCWRDVDLVPRAARPLQTGQWWSTVTHVQPWTDPGWRAEAHAWIREALDELGARGAEPIEQPHVRPWSTVMRVPTTDGDLWFKANAPVLAHEAAVVDVLARRRPDAVPELVAIDRERGWMLMRDGGVRLREIVAQERDLARWLDVLTRYAELQLDLSRHADELVALGAPDRRLAVLPAQVDRLLAEVPPMSGDEDERLHRLVADVAEMCRGLAALGVPETIQHDDLHDGQVFVRDGRYVFFDWGDSCVSHPFFSMAVTLEGGLSWGLDDVEGSVDIAPFRDAYLEPFAAYGTHAELETAHAAALRLGWLCRALNVQMWASALDPADRGEWRERVQLRLRMALSGLPPRTLTQPGCA
jgi:hypothetical protein